MRILLLTCGGTIGSPKGDDGSTGDQAKFSGADFIEEIRRTSPRLLRGNPADGIESITVDDVFITKIDSTDLGSSTWSALVERIHSSYDDYDGFLISHGTNTLGYTASALSFSLPNIGKPIVLTGAQVPFQVAGSDAVANMANSLRVLRLGYDTVFKTRNMDFYQDFIGVFVVFGTHIIPGVRAKKTTEFDIEPFKTFNSRSVGRIRADEIRLDFAEYSRYRRYVDEMGGGAASSASDLIRSDRFAGDILSITAVPDSPSDHLVRLLDLDLEGLIIRAFGAGDVPIGFDPLLEAAQRRKVPIIITTQCPDGTSSLRLNKIAKRAIDRGVIPAWDMSMESMTVKLRWLIGNGSSYRDIVEQFPTSLRGEINPLE